MRSAWMAAAAIVWNGPSAAQIVSVALQTPTRDFGVFVGDLLTSTAVLEVQPGTVLDLRSLPPEGPASPTIDVRQVAVGGTSRQIEIRVTYQSFFSPEQVSSAEVPGYTVAFSAGGRRLRASVPGFRFTASTFRHDLQPTIDPAALRPDHRPVAAQASTAAWQIAAGLLLMAGGLLALTWPYAFAGRQAPFGRAAKELARLQRTTRGDAPFEAMLVLHRAFDATAGRRMFADDLDAFVSSHNQFLPLRLRIAAFFDLSRAVFFGADVEAPGVASWMGLCRDLAAAERFA